MRAGAPRKTFQIVKLYLALAFVLIASNIARAEDPALQAVRERLDSISKAFTGAEDTVKQSSLRDSDFIALRDRINPLRAEIRTNIGDLEPRYAETQKRLTELGVAPKDGVPPEDARITAERANQTTLLADIDGVLKQAKLLNVRGDQLSDRIDTARHSRFKERLLSRTESILSPSLWIPAAKAISGEVRSFGALLSEWNNYAQENTSTGTLLLAPVAILALVIAVFLLRRMLLRHLDKKARQGDMLQNHRSRSAYVQICQVAIDAAVPPLTAFAAIDILSAFDLISPRIDQLTSGFLTAVATLSVGAAVTRAMVKPAQKLLGFDEAAATRLYHAVAGAVAVISFATLIFAFHRVLGAPSILRSTTSAIMTFLVAILVVRVLLIKNKGVESQSGLPNFIRFIGWIVVTAIFLSLATGHINFAAFIAARLVDAAVICCAALLLLALINSIFAPGFSEEGSHRRRVASAVGIHPARLDLLATITAGLLRSLLLVVVLFLIVGGWRTSVTDVASLFDRFDFDFSIGQSRLALGSLLVAIGLLIIGLIVTRIIHRWLTQSVLPRTGLDTGLQNSISTMFVYLGVIAAGLLALAQVGIDLQNIAFVAGALSVGIGFGLQSVVSNFVSGIILLAERPIRVGDIVEVKGASGYVRKISVRSTEIETGERANVIVPNSELISNVVTNWTHSNTTGGINIKLGVSYDSDPAEVRKILLEAAGNHPQILKAPGPSVLLRGFGDYALEFQLFCVIGNIDVSGTVKSDLFFAILQRFREEKIEIPLPQQEYRIRADNSAILHSPRGDTSANPKD